MIHRTRLALAAGILALGLAGCQGDADLATAPSRARRAAPDVPAVPPPAPAPDRAASATGDIALADAQIGTGWTGPDGHFYSVLFVENADGAEREVHYRDGLPYAGFNAAIGGANVAFYGTTGSLFQEQFVVLQSAMAARAQGGLRPPPPIGLREDRFAGERQAAIPCAEEIRGYAVAAAAMIAAGYALERNPTSSKLRSVFRGTIVGWALAWVALYDCMNG